MHRTALGRLLVVLVVIAAGCTTNERAPRTPTTAGAQLRESLFRELQPVTLARCQLQRFGEVHDGGYLLCGNLLEEVRAAYSYGISGYDGWGCAVSSRVAVPVHQYDCFDTRRTSCAGGDLQFHEECIAARASAEAGRLFATLQQQIQRNGDAGKRLLVKMDVEGAEWDALLWAPSEVLTHIDQLAIEFHGVEDSRYVVAVQRLKEYFHVAHLHFNNHSCAEDAAPFPATAYEVLFVNKRLDAVSDTRAPARPHPLDAPNDAAAPDCQS
jgi:hypothetical protein